MAAALGGVPLLSFFIVATNVGLAAAWSSMRRGARRAAATCLGVAVAIPALLAVHGTIVLAMDVDSTGDVRVAAVQGDISPYAKWSERGTPLSFRRYMLLTQRAVAERPDLVVWPETAIPAPLDEQSTGLSRARTMRRRVEQTWGVPLLFGVPEKVADTPGKHWNSAVLFRPDGVRVAAYRKRRLVPFAEYRPLPSLLGFIPRVVGGPEILPGFGGEPFEVSGARVGVLICFEDVFPEEAIERAGAADLLVVMTNDAWFSSAGREQHLDIAALRAVETGRSVARAANTGVTALIDPRGRVIDRAPPGQTYAIGELPISRSHTLFTRAPDLFPMLALAATLLALAFGFVIRRRVRPDVARSGGDVGEGN